MIINNYYTLSIICFLMFSTIFSCAYYNTYYNADKLFKSAQARPLGNNDRPTNQAVEEYNKVIRKCGYIIQEYPKSKWAEQALFLLAQSLYYRGNNQVQSMEKFEDIILYYPKSSLVNPSYIYIATIKYDLNQKDESFDMLRNFILNNNTKEYHPKALLKLANLYLQEENYQQALIYLTMIIEKYPKSVESTDAYITLGKTYFDIKNYHLSNDVFNESMTRKQSNKNKNEALYYIAYNYFHLAEYQKARQILNTLLKRELWPDKIAEQRILYSRVLAEIGYTAEAIKNLEQIIIDNPRTLYSAEAAFYMGDIQFHKLLDYEAAIESYNKVQREAQRSDFALKSITKSAVASQILQYYRQRSSMSTEQLITEQYKLAEYYLYELSLPDSALFIYKRIPEQRDILVGRKDVINNEIDHYYLYRFEVEIPVIDTILVTSDSLKVENDEIALQHQDIDDLFSEIVSLEIDINNYNNVIIPQSYFMCLVVYRQFFNDETQVQYYYQKLLNEYPEDRYTEAAIEFMNGKKVTYLTRSEKEEYLKFENAMSYFLKNEEIELDSLMTIISILKPLTESNIIELANKSIYTLGFINFYDIGDTLNAKVFFDTLLVKAPTSDFATNIRKFYNGDHFISFDRLPYIIEAELRKAEEEREAVERQLHESGVMTEFENELYFLQEEDFSDLLEIIDEVLRETHYEENLSEEEIILINDDE